MWSRVKEYASSYIRVKICIDPMTMAIPSSVVALRTTIHYGEHRSNVADLWQPDGDHGAVPVVVLIHGGFWRAQYTKVLMNGLAKSLIRQGWAAWNIEYRRVGLLGGGGGWPGTFDDVAAAIDHLATVSGIDISRVVTCGHSAGGQLALWAAARGRLPGGTPGTPPLVSVRAAISLAGVVNLRDADRLGLGGDATSTFLGGHWEQHKDRYELASPDALLPFGIPQVLVHGLEDGVVPPSMSEKYQAQGLQLGESVRYLPIEGVGHRDITHPHGPGWAATMAELEHVLD